MRGSKIFVIWQIFSNLLKRSFLICSKQLSSTLFNCKIDRRAGKVYVNLLRQRRCVIVLILCASMKQANLSGYILQIYPDTYCKFIRIHVANLSGYMLQIYPHIYCKFLRIHIANLSRYILQIYPDTYCKFIQIHIADLSGYIWQIYLDISCKFIQIHIANLSGYILQNQFLSYP